MRQLTAPIQPTTATTLTMSASTLAGLFKDLRAATKAWGQPVRSQAVDPDEAAHIYDSPIGWAGR